MTIPLFRHSQIYPDRDIIDLSMFMQTIVIASSWIFAKSLYKIIYLRRWLMFGTRDLLNM